MQTFEFKALDTQGLVTRGSESGDDREAVVHLLQDRGLVLLDLKEAPGRPGPAEARKKMSWEPLGLSGKTVTFFTRQLSSLLEAGVPLADCLPALQRQTTSPGLSAVLSEVWSDLQRGQSLSEAFGRHPRAFDPLYMSMLRVGEGSGNLAGALSHLADYRERDQELRSRVRGAMAYPLFILGFSMLLVWAMVSYLLPGFTPIFTSSGLDLQEYPITTALMAVSRVLSSPVDDVIILLVLPGVGLALRAWVRRARGRRLADRVMLYLPVVGNLVRLQAMARICHTFGVLMAAGVPLLNAWPLAVEAAGNSVFAEALRQASRQVELGGDVAVALTSAGLFPPLMLQMVAVGEQSGSLDKMFPRMARYYDGELATTLASISSVLEPVIMVFVGGLVFVFVLGVLLPILGIVSSIQTQM